MTIGAIKTLKSLGESISDKNRSAKMPVLFIGHGSPMNALANDKYTKTLFKLGKKIPLPKAILVISAHWMTQGTWVTEMEKPKTIYDFSGFPEELYKVRYPAPGSPEFAKVIRETVKDPKIHGDSKDWGLDHGTWSVLKHMYPDANIPVLQLSLDLTKTPEYHFKIGQELAKLREMGVLILGSGNLVHNLRAIRWEPDPMPFEWASEFDEWIKNRLEARDFDALMNRFSDTQAGKLSVPTLDHYYPLHYILGSSNAQDELNFEFEEIQNGSISMRCLSFSAI